MKKNGGKGDRPAHVLLIMVDGVGLPEEPLETSIYKDCPALCECFAQHSVPLDATLGVPGEPQSATGQTALFTGVNAARKLGRHLSGFPNAQLREVVSRENIFRRLRAQSFSATFANAYVRTVEQTLPRPLQSVTTVATLSAFGQTRQRADLLAGRAVYHDLTRQWLREHGKVDVPMITEETAARHLLTVLRSVDFCLFEYFLTDHAGHRGDRNRKRQVLASLDRFFAALMANLDCKRELLVWTSDHGNIEVPATNLHTCNPVPFVAYGWHEAQVRTGMTRIEEVSYRIEEVLA